MTKEEMEELSSLEKEKLSLAKTRVELELTLKQKRLYEGGRMLDARQYNMRMDTARQRLKECAVRQMEVNSRMKELRRKRNEAVVAAKGLDVQDPLSLIGHAYNLLHRLASEGVDLDPQEQAVIDALRHYLAHMRTE